MSIQPDDQITWREEPQPSDMKHVREIVVSRGSFQRLRSKSPSSLFNRGSTRESRAATLRDFYSPGDDKVIYLRVL